MVLTKILSTLEQMQHRMEMVNHADQRNAYRMPDYHRLDLGFNYHKKKGKTERIWSFGAYNTYNRKNAFMLYESYEDGFWGEGEPQKVIKQLSLLPILPYVRWSIKF